MRVLLLGATDVRNSEATLLLAKALERAGCVVAILPVTTDLPLLATIGYAGGRSGDRAYQASFNRRLLVVAREFGPDLVFIYGSNWCVLPSTIRTLQRRNGCQVVLWEVNQRIFGGFESATMPLYDRVFALDSYFVPVLRVAGAHRVQHLCACADPNEHTSFPLSAGEERRYAAEVSFIGNRSEERVAMLSQVAHADLRIFGTGWADVGPPLDSRVLDEPIYGLKKAKVYSASRLSLNVHQPHMVHGENFRVFEVAACGGVNVSAYKPDLVRCLEPGREVVIFEGPDDLRRKVDHYLAHPDERDEISRAGRTRVLAEHTYDHRARTIVELTNAD